MENTFDLDRFVTAQSAVYADVIAELMQGRKQSHWMWFIFPQLIGLGTSSTAIHFSLLSEAEAQAYIAHPILGRRLQECTEILLQLQHKSAVDIFGQIDAMKLRSSMTLFDQVQGCGIFMSVLEQYFHGQRDQKTLALLESASSSL